MHGASAQTWTKRSEGRHLINAEAAAAFTEIATSTGGVASKLTSAEVLVDAVCIQALEQMGGAEMAEKYKVKYLAFTS